MSENVYDLLLPDGKPMTFRFGGKYPDLHFTLKPDYTIREQKHITQLFESWQNYFQTPDRRLKESDHAQASKITTQVMVTVTEDDFDSEAFERLPEGLRMRILAKVQTHVAEIMDPDGLATGRDERPDPNGLIWPTNSHDLRAPTAVESTVG